MLYDKFQQDEKCKVTAPPKFKHVFGTKSIIGECTEKDEKLTCDKMIPTITISSSIHSDAWTRMYMYGMARVVVGLKWIKKMVYS